MFTRSWPLHSARYMAAHHHIDLENGIAPLMFMGTTGFKAPGLECDLWLGPTGDLIFHLHEPYPRDFATVGMPHWLNRAALDHGIACVYIRASNPEWHRVIARSIAAEFEDAPIFWRNAVVTDARTGQRRTGTIPERYGALADAIHQAVFVEGRVDHGVRFSHDITCGHRFLVKIGLGFGALFLDPSYVVSPDAVDMRSRLWTHDPNTWTDGLAGSPFFSQIDETFDRLTDWRGCHILMLHQHEEGIGLSVKLYGRYFAAVKIASSDFGFSNRFSAPHAMWIVAPGLRLFAGPMSLDEYTFAYLHPCNQDRLAFLRAAIDGAPMLPPFDVPQVSEASGDDQSASLG